MPLLVEKFRFNIALTEENERNSKLVLGGKSKSSIAQIIGNVKMSIVEESLQKNGVVQDLLKGVKNFWAELNSLQEEVNEKHGPANRETRSEQREIK